MRRWTAICRCCLDLPAAALPKPRPHTPCAAPKSRVCVPAAAEGAAVPAGPPLWPAPWWSRPISAALIFLTSGVGAAGGARPTWCWLCVRPRLPCRPVWSAERLDGGAAGGDARSRRRALGQVHRGAGNRPPARR